MVLTLLDVVLYWLNCTSQLSCSIGLSFGKILNGTVTITKWKFTIRDKVIHIRSCREGCLVNYLAIYCPLVVLEVTYSYKSRCLTHSVGI